jgi:predicted anti-sigma-YlaC factor YlaD
MDAPLNRPVDGRLWRLSATRGLNIGGLEAELSPTFALGDSRYQPGVGGARAGLNLGLSQLSDRIDLSVNYLSAGWAPTADAGDDVQMTLNFTQSTGAIMPGIRNMAETLRLPWQRRR